MREVDLNELMPKPVRSAQARLVRLPAALHLGENPVSATLLAPGTADATQWRLAKTKHPQDARAIRRAKVLYDAWLSFYRGSVSAAQEEVTHLFDDISRLETAQPAADGPGDAHAPAPAKLQKLGAAYLICCHTRYGMKRYYADAAVAYLSELADETKGSGHQPASPEAQAASIDLAMYEMSIGILSDVPAWIKEGEFGVGRAGDKLLFSDDGVHPDNLYAAVLASIQYKNYQGEYLKSLSLVDMAEKVLGMRSVVIGDIYFALYRALNLEALGYPDDADASLKCAIEMVRKDRLWQIVAEFAEAFGGKMIPLIEAVDPDGAEACKRISDGLLDRIKRSHEDEKGRRGHKGLTAQELAVMRLVAAGLRNAEIADELHIGAETVKFHKRNASQKLGTRPRATTAEVKEALERNRISAEWISQRDPAKTDARGPG